MAFTPAKLLLVHGEDPQLFKYQTDDSLGEVASNGYFNAAVGRLHKGDMILVSGDLGGATSCVCLCVTSATWASTVTVI